MWTHAKLFLCIFKMGEAVYPAITCVWIEIPCSAIYHVFVLAIKAHWTVTCLHIIVVLFMRLLELAVVQLCSHLFLLVHLSVGLQVFFLSSSFSSILSDFSSTVTETFQFCFFSLPEKNFVIAWDIASKNI